MEQLERELALLALTAQRTELVQLARKRLVDEEAVRKLLRETDLHEIRLA